MIKLTDVKRTYTIGSQAIDALHGVSLEVNSGEMLAIVGPSGSGKSTLLNMIGLLDRPDSGEYYLNDVAVHATTANQRAVLRNRYIGFVFQSFFLLPRLNALQNISLPLFYRGLNTKAANQQALQMLRQLGLANYWQHKPAELSGGQQQRIAIARALVGQPNIVLADEPTGSLDSVTSQEIMELLKEINHQQQTTLIIITHDAKVAQQCQRTIHIRDGVIAYPFT